MQIVFHCPKCSSKLETTASDAGIGIECPTCGNPLVVPSKGAEPGTTIGGFKLVKIIGRGGMGEVYLARQISLDRMVALKLMTRTDMDGGAAARFLDEIRLTARLDHPYLVPAYEAGEDVNVLYLAMAYIRGSSLHDHVRRNGPMTEADTLILGHKIASALAYAWREIRLLHRDIKPANILLDSNGEPRLADLGLAKCIGKQDGRTISGSLLGTPNYMSPEQAEGRNDLDVRSDIYGFGATLYTAVTGRIPYEAASVLETLRRQATEPLPDPRTYTPGLSQAFVELLGSMLACDRNERPSRWEDVIEQIDQLLAKLTGTAAILPIMHAARRTATAHGRFKSWQSLAGLTAGVIISASLGIIAGLILLRPPVPGGKPTPTDPPAAGATTEDSDAAPPATAPGSPTTDRGPADDAAVDMPSIEDLVNDEAPLPPDIRDRIMKGMADAFDHARRRPEDLEGFLERMQAIAELVPERGPLHRRIMEAIRDAPAIRERALEKTRERLIAGTNREIKLGRFTEGLAALEAYRGPFAEELAGLRDELVERLRQARLDAAIADAHAIIASATEASAAALVNGNPEAAVDIVRAIRVDPDADPEGTAGNLQRLVDELASLPTCILQSFSAQVGKEIPVEFRSGQVEPLRIAGVEAGTVIGRRLLREGFIERPFKTPDLSLKEKLARVAMQDPAAAHLARGLIHLEHGDSAKAIESFETAGVPLGSSMARALTEKQQPSR